MLLPYSHGRSHHFSEYFMTHTDQEILSTQIKVAIIFTKIYHVLLAMNTYVSFQNMQRTQYGFLRKQIL